MNRTRLLTIGIVSLALGILASMAILKRLQSGNVSRDNTVEVIVAANDLQVGSRIEEKDIKIIRVPPEDLPPGAPRKRSDVLGHGVIIPIAKGEFVLPNRLAAENAGAGLPSLIPPNMRAVSVRVNDVVSVAGFVTPGTRVDVLLTAAPNGSSEQETTTVLQNVAVLASGHTLERTSTGEAQNTAVITLLVTPEDGQRLTLASSEGRIQLALRNPLDTKQDSVPTSSARGLFKEGAPEPVHAAVHHVSAPKVTTPQPPPGVSVEVYQGDKPKQEVKFQEGDSESK